MVFLKYDIALINSCIERKNTYLLRYFSFVMVREFPYLVLLDRQERTLRKT